MSVIYTKRYIMIEESEGFIRIRDRNKGKNIIKIDTGNKVWNRIIGKNIMDLFNNDELSFDPKDHEFISCPNSSFEIRR